MTVLRRARILGMLAAALLLPPASAAQVKLEAGARVAFLGMTFIDTSTEGAYGGAREDETERTRLVERAVLARFQTEGFELVDVAPVAERLARVYNPARCNGCDLELAGLLDADYALVGEIQKVSNLILAMNLVLRERETGRRVRGLAVDIRSNTDESWLRGIRYILDNAFFPD